MRYGGDWQTQWDGSALLANPAYRLPTPSRHAADAAWMSGMLDGFPAVPEGWDGWFYRR